jgi:hypothetical protein
MKCGDMFLEDFPDLVFHLSNNPPQHAILENLRGDYSDAIDAFSKYFWDRDAKPIRRS